MFINFLTIDDVMKIHARQLEEFGGANGLRDRSGLEAAITQPQASWGGQFLYETIFDMAAVYAFHIAEAQAFVDGNKRTALNTALVFLLINGYRVSHQFGPEMYDAMIGIATKEVSKEDLADIIRDLVIDSKDKT